MSWSLAIGCIFAITVIIYVIANRVRHSRSRYRRRSRQLIDTTQITWRDISTSSFVPLPDQSSIEWHDLPPDLSSEGFSVDCEFNELWELDDLLVYASNDIDPSYNANIQELLRSVIGTRDLLTQEEFIPGQQVYFCQHCTLAYHEDSWQESDNRCIQCSSDQHTRLYTLPHSI